MRAFGSKGFAASLAAPSSVSCAAVFFAGVAAFSSSWSVDGLLVCRIACTPPSSPNTTFSSSSSELTSAAPSLRRFFSLFQIPLSQRTNSCTSMTPSSPAISLKSFKTAGLIFWYQS